MTNLIEVNDGNGSTISYDSSRERLQFVCDLNEFDPVILLQLLDQYAEPIIFRWIASKFPDLDLDTYEGGFDSWWGMGSVTMFELGLDFTFAYSRDTVTVTIS